MTDTKNTQITEDDKAKGAFAGLLTLGGGGAGLLIAGLVLAVDYMLHGEPDKREQLAKAREKRNRRYYEDSLAWIEADRKAREAHREALRKWYADTEGDRGDRPKNPEDGPGRVARWFWSWLVIGTTRAKKGWKAGRKKAREQQAAGQEQWWKVKNSAEPDTDPATEPVPASVPTDRPAADPVDVPLDDVVDAEIVEDQTPAPEKAGAETDDQVKGFGERLDRLRADADQTLAAETEPTQRPALR